MYVNVLKFRTLVACQKGLDKQCRPISGQGLPLFDKHFVNFRPDNQHFIREEKEKSVWNFRTYSLSINYTVLQYTSLATSLV